MEDVVSLTDPQSVERTVDNIVERASKLPGPFNYNPAKRVSRAVASGEVTEKEILRACQCWTKGGTTSNKEAALLIAKNVRLICPPGVICFDAPNAPLYEIRQDLIFSMKIPFFFSYDKKVYLPWIQFTKNGNFTSEQWGVFNALLCDLYESLFLPNPYETILIDLSAPLGSKNRKFRIFRAPELPVFDKQYLTDFFSVYAAAYDICRANGVERAKPKEKSKAKDSLTYDLFTDLEK